MSFSISRMFPLRMDHSRHLILEIVEFAAYKSICPLSLLFLFCPISPTQLFESQGLGPYHDLLQSDLRVRCFRAAYLCRIYGNPSEFNVFIITFLNINYKPCTVHILFQPTTFS